MKHPSHLCVRPSERLCRLRRLGRPGVTGGGCGLGESGRAAHDCLQPVQTGRLSVGTGRLTAPHTRDRRALAPLGASPSLPRSAKLAP